MELIWKSVLIVIGGTVLLRIAGRKSISQITLAQVVIMIGIGSLLIQPLADENIWATLGIGVVLVLTLVIMEYGQVKSDILEKMILGQSVTIIQDGRLVKQNLKKVRLTIDQLETQLRQSSVQNISDIQHATLEPNGRVGYILKPSAQTANKADLETVHQEVQELKQLLQQVLTLLNPNHIHPPSQPPLSLTQQVNQEDLFQEVEAEGHIHTPPEDLR